MENLVAPVENIREELPMKMGIGKPSHRAALYAAGASKVYMHPEDTDFLREYSGFREGDTVILVQPKMLRPREYEQILEAATGPLTFQVAGHDPVSLDSAEGIDAFRELRPKGKQIEVVQTAGRPAKVRYTLQQAEAILRLWWDVPRRPPGEVKKMAEIILGLDAGSLKDQWVKDLAIKYVGTAKRTMPAGFRGLSDD